MGVRIQGDTGRERHRNSTGKCVWTFPQCLQGFANLLTRQYLGMRNWPNGFTSSPGKLSWGEISHAIGSQKILNVRVKFRAVQIQPPFRLKLPWLGLCRCHRSMTAGAGIFATSVRFSKCFGHSAVLCCICIMRLTAEEFQLHAVPQAERV